MTAVLIARLVEQGRLNWSETLAGVVPEVARQIPEAHRLVTLEQFLQHRSGFPANARDWWMRQGDEVQTVRREILVDSLNRLKLQPPGQAELYSNLGYLGAGVIAESATGKSWEELMTVELFRPLGLPSSGFGPPSSDGRIDQPWGHQLIDGKLQAGQFDNAPALGPAGTVHLSLSDWFTFCELFAGGGPPGFLQPESLGKLVEPDLNSEYAYGWGVLERKWARGRIYLHSGSNRWWFCKVCIAPQLKRIFLCVFNRGGDDVDQWAETAFREMIQLSSQRVGQQ
jgi:CubicO group peptidase (beta-lactamase class C family)